MSPSKKSIISNSNILSILFVILGLQACKMKTLPSEFLFLTSYTFDIVKNDSVFVLHNKKISKWFENDYYESTMGATIYDSRMDSILIVPEKYNKIQFVIYWTSLFNNSQCYNVFQLDRNFRPRKRESFVDSLKYSEVTYYKNGNILEYIPFDGVVKSGWGWANYKDGSRYYEVYYKNNAPYGYLKVFRKDGNLKTIFYYNENGFTGILIYYDKNGNPSYTKAEFKKLYPNIYYPDPAEDKYFFIPTKIEKKLFEYH